MLPKELKFLKTAALTAVFYLLSLAMLKPAVATEKSINSLEVVKKKSINLLMQAQKSQALSILEEYIAKEVNKNFVKEARDFRQKIAKKFLTKEAQEAYEMSLNFTIENSKLAKKYIEECLKLDAENLECQTQNIRLQHRDKQGAIKAEALESTNKFFELPEQNWIRQSTEKTTPAFKTRIFLKKDYAKLTEEKLTFAILEIERSLMIKNYSKAKEVLNQIEKNYADWPDYIYFKNKIDAESSEAKTLHSSDYLNEYQTKCKNINKSIARKYRYDFDLCLRGVL